MKIKALLTFAVASFLIAGADAGTIASSNLIDAGGNDILITNASGTRLSTGYVASGYFSVTDADVSLASASTATLFALASSSFVALATDNFSSLGVAGLYTANADYGAPGANLGKTLYTFVGNGTTIQNSTQILVYRHNETIGLDTPLPDSNNLAPTGGTLLAGSTGPNTTYDSRPVNGPNGNQNLSAGTLVLSIVVPEPSTMMLGAIGALGLLRRRR